MICKSGAQTLDGGRSLFSKESTSATSKTQENVLMCGKEKISRVKRLLSGIDITVLTKDGRSSILTRNQRWRSRVLTKSSDSTSTDHSTSSLNFHSTELLRCTVTLMCGSRDGEIMLHSNSGGSMKSQRLSETTMDHGRIMH
jgi:hypothetical protein